MSGDELYLIVLAGWAAVTLVIAGVVREYTGKWGDGAVLAFAWPIAAPVVILVGLGWCLAWLGRAPTRYFVRRARARGGAERIARAEVHRG